MTAVLCLLAVSPAVAQRLTPQANYGEPNGTFPNWQERAVQELTNRARVDPATELAGCPSGQCLDAACYAAMPPLAWIYDLNQSSRFESASMGRFPFFAHDTPCVLFSDINARYPGSSDGSFASSCSSSGTTFAQNRVQLFGASFSGENIAAGSAYRTPHSAFYAWLYETTSSSACGFRSDNGHRYNILTNGGPGLGVGFESVPGSPWLNYWTQDFGGSGTVPKIPSGSHWTSVNHVRDPSAGDDSVEFWANWYDAAGAPTQSNLILDGVPSLMTRSRGTTTNAAYSVTAAGVASGCHTYYFSFVDSGLQTVRYPTTGVLGLGAGCPDWQASSVAPPAPTGVNARASSGTQVLVTWTAVTGATSYDVYRRDPGGAFALRGSSLTASFTDTATASTAYLYRVRAVNAGGTSGDSAYDLATTVIFTDDPLMAGLTVIRAIHLAELRTAVNAVRAQASLGAASFTDAASAGVLVKAVHINELRTALDAAMSALSLAAGGWTDVPASGVAIKAVHFQEIRDRMK